MTDFEQRSLELFSDKQKALIEKHRKSFRRWFDPLRKLEPDYREEQLEMIPMTEEEKRAAAIELVKKAGDPVTENNIQLAIMMIDSGVEVE